MKGRGIPQIYSDREVLRFFWGEGGIPNFPFSNISSEKILGYFSGSSNLPAGCSEMRNFVPKNVVLSN